jgi:hypothetical protein
MDGRNFFGKGKPLAAYPDSLLPINGNSDRFGTQYCLSLIGPLPYTPIPPPLQSDMNAGIYKL